MNEQEQTIIDLYKEYYNQLIALYDAKLERGYKQEASRIALDLVQLAVQHDEAHSLVAFKSESL